MELASPKKVEFLEEWEVKRFWNDSAKDSTPQQLNSHLPVEEIESGNVGNPFPEIIDENRKSLNGYELLKQAFPIKKLEKAKTRRHVMCRLSPWYFHQIKTGSKSGINIDISEFTWLWPRVT